MKKYLTLLTVLQMLIVTAGLIPVKTLAESKQLDVKNEIPVLCAAPLMLKDGYYVAVAAGYDIYKMKDNTSYNDINNIEIVKANPELAVNGMIGDFVLGYGKLFGKSSNLYLGAEFFANGSAADSDFEINASSIPVIIDTDVVVNGSFGLAILPGIKINKTSMIYLKAGYSWSTASVDETFRTEVDYEFKSIEYNDALTVDGFLYGIGLESAFNENFSLRAEYSHVSYSSFYTGAGAKIEPSRDQFLFGLAYHFASRA